MAPSGDKWGLGKAVTGPTRAGELSHAPKIVVLSEYEECIGDLHRLEEYNGMLLAEIGKIVVALPVSLNDMMIPNLNRKIAVLRTDIPGKQYLLRVL